MLSRPHAAVKRASCMPVDHKIGLLVVSAERAASFREYIRTVVSNKALGSCFMLGRAIKAEFSTARVSKLVSGGDASSMSMRSSA